MVMPRITPTTVRAAGRPALMELVMAVVIAVKSAATIFFLLLRLFGKFPYFVFALFGKAFVNLDTHGDAKDDPDNS